MIAKITAERLKSILDYDPETGLFVWKKPNTNRLRPGDRCGTMDGKGHIQMMVDRVQYSGHRLAWFWVHGEWPIEEIDHIDRDRSNNRIANLRQATKSQNRANTAAFSNNKSGLKGVHFCGDHLRKPWRALINHQGKKIHLGRFATPEEAHAAYAVKAQSLFGEFARAA